MNYTALPIANLTTYARLPPLAAMSDGTRRDCNDYFDGDDFQDAAGSSSFNGSSASFTPCQVAADSYGVGLDDLGSWNAGLSNVSSPDCRFLPGVRYCGRLYVQTSLDNDPEDDSDDLFVVGSHIKRHDSGLRESIR